MTRPKSSLIGVMSVVLILGLAACSASEDSGGGELQEGGTFVVARTADIDKLDPHVATAFGTFQTLGLVYDTLTDTDDQLEVVPSLAEEFEYSEDGRTLTFTLREGITTEISTLPGAQRILDALPDGRWAIVTSGSRLLAEARMRACELPVPSVMVTAEDVVEGKPHPAGYERAAGLLGVPPAACVVFEDAPPGIEAARAAGARVIGVATTHSPSALSTADAFVDTLLQISLDGGPGDNLVLRPA